MFLVLLTQYSNIDTRMVTVYADSDFIAPCLCITSVSFYCRAIVTNSVTLRICKLAGDSSTGCKYVSPQASCSSIARCARHTRAMAGTTAGMGCHVCGKLTVQVQT